MDDTKLYSLKLESKEMEIRVKVNSKTGDINTDKMINVMLKIFYLKFII